MQQKFRQFSPCISAAGCYILDMMTRPKFIAFAAMSLWCAAVWARPASLQVIAPDTTLELASTKQHGNYFVALNDLRRKMNLAVLEDQEAKLIILASVFDCVPVYAADEQDAITVDKTPFIRWELAAKALGVSQPVRQNNVHVDHPLADLLKARIGTEVGDHAAGFG
ncbi:MAG: hypothetical protein HY966_01775, partial [Ignavibacteriales bacterium]|nr:hypothetical protein [Ignavibacteriales bacterium]